MKKRLEDQFSKIAQKTVEDASHVDCAIEEYREGLRLIVEELGVSIEAATEDLKRMEHGGSG